MSWLSQWQFWVAFINLSGLVVVFVFNKFAHDKLVSNDLLHISTDIKTLLNNQKSLNDKLDKTNEKTASLAEDVSYIKGKLEIPLTKKRKSQIALVK